MLDSFAVVKVAPSTLHRSAGKEPTVPKACDVCGKTAQYGNQISHAHNTSRRRWEPNLQPVRVLLDGVPKRLRVCTRCLRSGKVLKNVRSPRTPILEA
jgi:large subunit ribosomal protein L28